MSIKILKDRRFWPLFWTQFFGAFNDNVFKNGIVILITYKAYSIGGITTEQMVSLCGALLILPFFIFSATSGQIADKFSKHMVIRSVKVLEIMIMIIGMYGFMSENIITLFIALFLMGLHSALFGPVKYSILPNLLHDDELVTGNAYIETGTFIAILLGTILGVQMISVKGSGNLYISITIIAVAVTGFLFSLWVKPIAPAKPELKLNFNPVTTTAEIIKLSAEVKSIFNSILGISWFWFVGIAVLSMIPVYCKNFLFGDESLITLFLAIFSIGIGAGSVLCEKLSFKRTELGLVPLGSLGISIFAFDLYFAGQPLTQAPEKLLSAMEFLSIPGCKRIAIDMFLFSVSSGLFTVPLYTFIQQRSGKGVRSRIIAANNIMNAIFMVAASVFLILLYSLNFTYPQIFLIFAILNILVAAYIYTLIPEFLLRLVAWSVTNFIYRLKVIGRENLPMEGPFIIAANHVTFVDGFVISSGCPRPARFVMYYKYFTMPVVSRLFRDGKVIPIAGKNEDPEILKAAFDTMAAELKNDEVVCIFPEGELTHDGKMGEFKHGIEKLLETTPVPVVPACLNGLWGSYFSRKYKGKERKPFRRKWSRISVEFGKPIPPEEATVQKLYDIIAAMKTEES